MKNRKHIYILKKNQYTTFDYQKGMSFISSPNIALPIFELNKQTILFYFFI